MIKFKDDAIKLIKTMAKNSRHNVEKLFIRGAMPKRQLINAKSVETSMLLERIKKMAEVQTLLLDRLNIMNSSERLAPISLQEASPCANVIRHDHVELDYPIMVI